jgi:hypothetical protein
MLMRLALLFSSQRNAQTRHKALTVIILKNTRLSHQLGDFLAV